MSMPASALSETLAKAGVATSGFFSWPQSGCLLLHHKTPLSAANTIAAMSNFFVPILSALHEYGNAGHDDEQRKTKEIGNLNGSYCFRVELAVFRLGWPDGNQIF